MFKNDNFVVLWLRRVAYRLWQFKQTVLPRLDQSEWREAVRGFSQQLREHLNALRKSEKAHILRVYRAICADSQFVGEQRKEVLQLALLHDIGKAIIRSSVVLKVARVFLPIGRNDHCIAGARLLHRNGFDRKLVRRVLRHHTFEHDDILLQKFQQIDDSC
ncbi:MAG: HDIG domain-containing protein [Candidatus Riflebacteria bacterium]|nr:HDIG domain-containing protein [Candidatus Riflebacteria bacterium]